MRGEYFFYNDQLITSRDFNKVSLRGTIVYEVLRVIDGFALFFDDHFARLEHSCMLTGHKQPFDKQALYSRFSEIIAKNGFLTGNLMLKVAFQDEHYNTILNFIPHRYPSDDEYRNGVQVGFLKAERVNPEAKVEQDVRTLANSVLGDSSLFEVILVDHEGSITEGSRSNVFLVKDNSLLTAPCEKVLSGITMKKVLDIARKENIKVIFSEVQVADMGNYESMFLTGTSPKILPVACAGDYNFNVSHPLVKRLMFLYDELIANDILGSKQK